MLADGPAEMDVDLLPDLVVGAGGAGTNHGAGEVVPGVRFLIEVEQVDVDVKRQRRRGSDLDVEREVAAVPERKDVREALVEVAESVKLIEGLDVAVGGVLVAARVGVLDADPGLPVDVERVAEREGGRPGLDVVVADLSALEHAFG